MSLGSGELRRRNDKWVEAQNEGLAGIEQWCKGKSLEVRHKNKAYMDWRRKTKALARWLCTSQRQSLVHSNVAHKVALREILRTTPPKRAYRKSSKQEVVFPELADCAGLRLACWAPFSSHLPLVTWGILPTMADRTQSWCLEQRLNWEARTRAQFWLRSNSCDE